MDPGRRALVCVTLLLAPLVAAPSVPAQSEQSFALLGIVRAGDNVTFEVKATRYVFDPTISLYASGTLAALPERTTGTWQPGDVAKLTFTLIDPDLASATLTFRWREDAQTVTQATAVPIPKRDGSEPSGDGTARVLVASATLDGKVLTVRFSNVGDAASAESIASLEDAGGSKIGTPYYRVVPRIAAGASADVTFEVAGALSSVVVALEEGDAVRRVSVLVRSAGGGDGPTTTPPANVSVATDLPFREADIGRTVDYALTIRNTGRLALVGLEAAGLPSGYSARFFVGGSAVPNLYLDRNQTRQVTLSITVPNAATEVDRTIEFSIVARVNGTEMAKLPMGLAVRGVGRLEITGDNMIGKLPPGGTGTFTVTVTNAGSAPLFDVRLDSRRPYGWTLRFEPRTLDRLDPGESKAVTVEVRAPDVVGPGSYPSDLFAKSGDSTSRAQTLSVEIEQPKTATSWLWLVFLAGMGGVLGAAYKFRRRG